MLVKPYNRAIAEPLVSWGSYQTFSSLVGNRTESMPSNILLLDQQNL
jgi:hypothetical protein